MNAYDRETTVLALMRALPYIRLYRGKIFVVKVGGAMCGEPSAMTDLAAQLSVLRELGVKVVVVHGGGPQTTALADKLGLETTQIDGRRVTDAATLDVSVMTLNGSVRTALLSACRAAQLPAVGLSGLDAGLVRATRRPPQQVEVKGDKRTVDFGLVGDIASVEPRVVHALLDSGVVPVVSPLCADDAGQVLNVNGDTVASALACALGAEKLIFLTDTAGILERLNDPGSLVSYTDVKGLERLKESGALGTGMLPKAKATREALLGGVRRVHLVGYRSRTSLLVEVFTNEGSGTLVVRDTAELSANEQSGSAPA